MSGKDNTENIYIPAGSELVCDLCNKVLTRLEYNNDIALSKVYWLSWGLICQSCYDNTFQRVIEEKDDPDYDKVKFYKVFHSGDNVSEVRNGGTCTLHFVCPSCRLMAVIELGTFDDFRKKTTVDVKCPRCGETDSVTVAKPS